MEQNLPPIQWKSKKVIDAHVHFRDKEPVEHFLKIIKLVNYDKFNLLGGDLKCKNFLPGKVYTFGMIQHDTAKMASGDGAYLVAQLEKLISDGHDGVKMMDGKPACRRKQFPLPIDHGYYRPYWAAAEKMDAPITIHVSDPIDFWDPKSPDSLADFQPQEEFFRQAVAVLERHPNLRITFAHFLFLGPNLKRLRELFERFPKMRVDMAMGHEFLYYLSDDPDASRDFYIKWSKRILYGTDISDHNSLRHGRSKAETLRLFLETGETFDNLIYEAMNKEPVPGSNGRLKLRGLKLPQDVLDDVLWRNFESFAGVKPKTVK